MTRGFLDWLGRILMLALAGLVTLSIIGSIAAIPSESIETRMGLETQPPTADRPPLPESEPEAAAPQPEPTRQPAAPRGVLSDPGAPAASAPSEAARWLEAITYALLALVGLAALASLFLWRGLREQRRIADALEALAARS
ncbi:hypothetical protein [Sphingosinicella humi]|uniref:Uncharacterized protein n=1 Tax=Allosphingosinicella humi TaxID=2068657 RepID=A0A2U2J293_9SPHN|nr:hypothetical protein [Sphingosinicella humi]PWG02460.1 hypothetical protein DF286_05960 [Sphingosinicella humi]